MMMTFRSIVEYCKFLLEFKQPAAARWGSRCLPNKTHSSYLVLRYHSRSHYWEMEVQLHGLLDCRHALAKLEPTLLQPFNTHLSSEKTRQCLE
jgi:hypothetical protein